MQKKQVAVVPGTNYTLVIGAGAAGRFLEGLTGADSTFASTIVVAKGGVGGGAWINTTGSANGGSGASGAIVLTYTIVLATSKHHFILSGE